MRGKGGVTEKITVDEPQKADRNGQQWWVFSSIGLFM